MSLDSVKIVEPSRNRRPANKGFKPAAKVSAWYQKALRKSATLVHSLSLFPVYAMGAVVLGLSLTPAVALFSYTSTAIDGWNNALRFPILGITIALGYFAYGFSLLVVASVANLPFRFMMRPTRSLYHSSTTVPWYIHNSLMYLVRYTFLDFITPTPFNVAFLRWMGMKIGENTQINTSFISDPALLTIEDNVTLGGSCTICAHYGTGGVLVISPTIIRKGATVGLKCTILGGVEVGEKAVILPNSAVLPKTKIPAGETWGGVPARKIDLRAARD